MTSKPTAVKLYGGLWLTEYFSVLCPICGRYSKPSRTFKKINNCECGVEFDWSKGYEMKTAYVTPDGEVRIWE